MKSYEGKTDVNFHVDGIPKETSHCIRLSVSVILSAFKVKTICTIVLRRTGINFQVIKDKWIY